MAETAVQNLFANPVKRILQVIKLEKNEISSVYFYAILNGLIQLSLPLGIQSIISFVLGGTISTSLIVLIFLVVLGVFLNGMLQVNQMRLIEKVQQKIFVRYAFTFADRIPKLNLQVVDGYYLPELVNRFFDTIVLQKGISKLLLDIPTATIQIIFGLTLLSFYHPIFIFFGLTLVLVVYLILKITSSKGMQSSLQESDYKYSVVAWLQEMARIAKSLKFSKKNGLSLSKSDQLVKGYLESRTTHFKVLLSQYYTLIFFKVIITAAMLIVGSVLLVNQQLNIGQFIAAEIVILLVISSIEKLIINLDNVYDVLTAVEKLGKVVDKPLEQNGDIKIGTQNDGFSININALNFSYKNNEPNATNVLSNINVTINKNQKICIMGNTGSGKSTLLKMLTGAYKNYTGSISINDVPLVNYDLPSLRSQIGILLNQQDIFNGTLLENITMGNSSIDVNEIMKVADSIGLKEYINALPLGFSTILKPVGKNISQKIVYKILLMRALVGQPAMLLLEDPFSGSQTIDFKITDYLIHHTNNQTLVVVSNDEAFASQCDQVIFLQNGSIKYIGQWNDIKQNIKN
jgi:ATP-binding cassette, subfamily B, bacterial